jgi:outer membrane beta-barrel protein
MQRVISIINQVVCLLFFCMILQTAFAVEKELEEKFGARPLDGVYVRAVENQLNPRTNRVAFDLGVWPLQPYYNGFSLNFSYSHFFNKTYAWEILRFCYLYTVQTDLTAKLAEQYGVDKQKIERTAYVISSDVHWFFAYGKFLFFENNIRYFRSSLMAGPGLVSSNFSSKFGVDFGWSIETFFKEDFAWRLEIRDTIAFGADHPHNMSLNVGTVYGF